MDVSERLQEWVGTSGFVPVAFVFAALAGAAHAVAPGHGKTLAAAYLVGENGRMRDAVWLGGSVAVMHTVSVLVVAIAWTFYSVSDLVRITTLTTGLQLVAGLLTLATGVWLLQRNLRRRRDGPVVHGHGGVTHSHGGLVHSHGGVVHSHDHQHQHDHEHQHSHPEPGDHRPGHTTGDSTGHTMGQTTGHTIGHTIGRRPGLTVLGAAGGLVPSPTAFLVLVTGFFTGHAAFALLLVLTFGLGMAVVLSGVGLLAVQGSSLISRGARSRPALAFATRIAPMVGAVAISVVGTVIIAVSVTGLSTA